ncbi:hypothetical protein [Aliivibrio sifiae]|uniref:Flagellar protein FliT n=1 Tax=Aliivibrio sifiae TaxID=566293 RepID=A0A2S7XGP7_9GAMM|nr:hypothetical protein [Aliivibrio sifiae]PQJ92846.1 hypothetical protein BTO23_01780 [Aliivibrio sifiae]GLR74931.1 hypothetical protein GCM10007855_18050 [Aliivibrio sifiae]
MMLLQQLAKLDRELQISYRCDDINFEQVAVFLSDREQLLHQCMQVSEIVHSTEWQAAIERTQLIINEMNGLGQQFALDYQKLNHAKKSVQLYRKFQ